jgi:polyhydroxybutyrate depolymerase
MLNKLFLFLILCGLVTTNGKGQTTIDTTLKYDGLTRSYRLYIPSSLANSEPVPLVLNLHGYGSNNVQQEAYGDFRDIADTARFIIAHPNGTIDSSGNRFWDAFDASSVDDVGFLSSLIDTVSKNYAIDTNRIYSTGMSNGGFMSHQLVCRLGERITAIASVAGTMTSYQRNTCSPSSPTPIMQIHCTSDGTVPYSGNNQYLPVDSVIDYWVNYNNCSPNPTVTQIPDQDPSDGSTAEKYVYDGGTDHTTVELYKVIDGGHTWPGASVSIGVTNQDFDASKVIWQFFNRYKGEDTSTSVADEKGQSDDWRIYPNPSNGQIRFHFADQQEKNITIFHYTGKKAASFTCHCRTTTFTFDQKGVYFISTAQGNDQTTKKVVVR